MARATELAVKARARVAVLPESGARTALEDLSEYVLERRW